MAFANRSTAAVPQNSDSWKATAFLNVFVKRKDGTRMKIGAIALRDSKKVEAALIARLSEKDGVACFMKALEIDFNLVDDGTPAVLGF